MAEQLTKGEIRELMREQLIPILPDQSVRAHLLACRLFLKYGVISFLCGNRQTIPTRLDPFCRFLRLDREDERLCAEQLADLTEKHDDRLFLLFALSEKDRAFASAYAPLLESRLILADPRSFPAEVPFASLH